MKALVIGFWIDLNMLESRPTMLPPDPTKIAPWIAQIAHKMPLPDRVLYIECRPSGPSITYSWCFAIDYGPELLPEKP